MLIEVLELAPRAFAAALFKIVLTLNGDRLQIVRQATGPTALQAVAALNAPQNTTVVQHIARNSIYERIR